LTLQLQSVAPARGLLWVRQGMRVFMRRPMAFTTLFTSFLLVGLLVTVLIPVLGGVIAVMALPLLSLGFMMATHAALQNAPVHPGLLIQPLRAASPQRGTLLRLCVLYGLATVAVFLLCDWFDGGTFEQLQVALSKGADASDEVAELVADPRLLGSLWLRMGLTSLLSVPFWHAPALVHWSGQGVAQSLFSSTLACWRAKGAFTLYALGWFGLFALFGTVVTLLGSPRVIALALMPAALLFTTMFYVSLYFTFADSFKAREAVA